MTIQQFQDGEILSSVRNKINSNDEELDNRVKSLEAGMDELAGVEGGPNGLTWLLFDTTPTPAATEPGSMFWDASDNAKTLSVVMDGTQGTTLQLGQEQYYRVKASSVITNGQVVMYTGAQGNSGLMLGAPAQNISAGENDLILGVATENIALNASGYVTQFGLVRDINTTGSPQGEVWSDGDLLFYNPSIVGGITNVRPTAPNPIVHIGNVLRANTSGSIMVRVHHGSTFGYSDGNVQITSPQNNDFVVYDGTQSRWENYTPANARAALGLGTMATQNAGDLVVSPQQSVTPVSNGQMVFQLTNNTTLVIKVRGTDGVVRSATLTLS